MKTPYQGSSNNQESSTETSMAKTKTFEDFLKEEDSPIVYCTLKLDGKDFLDTTHFTLDLNQFSGTHDFFTITLLDDALDSYESEIMAHSRSLLGKSIEMNLHRFGTIQFTFEGVITSVSNRKESGYGDLVIKGHSPTIFLENGEHCQSFESKTLNQIVEEATSDYKGKVSIKPDEQHFNQKNQGLVLPYVVQYMESDYQFLQRLAKRYGEWLFYDGRNLVMGAKIYDTITLEEGVDLIEVEFNLNTLSQDFNFVSYDRHSGDDKQQSSSSVSNQNKINPMQFAAIKASSGMYQNTPELLFNVEADEVEKQMEIAAWRRNESRKNVMTIKGKSRDPKLSMGRDIKLIDINDTPMETYRIMSVRHYHNGAGEYYNEFEAVPFDTFVPPYFDERALPICEEQSAIVTDNNDPEGMSRIRVQFPWQKIKDEKSPWLRVVTPYAGEGKGMHVLPEVGEEVIVGFESGNAEKPFVFGAMFHGNGKSNYGTSDNDQKVIHTRSGTKIIFNDAQGSIFIEDPSGNNYLMDGNGNIEMNAVNNFKINAGKNMDIAVGENLNFQVGGNVQSSIAKAKTEQIGENFSHQVRGSAKVYITGSLTEVIEGDVDTEVHGGKTSTNADEGIDTFSRSTIQQHAQKKVMNMGGQKSLSL